MALKRLRVQSKKPRMKRKSQLKRLKMQTLILLKRKTKNWQLRKSLNTFRILDNKKHLLLNSKLNKKWNNSMNLLIWNLITKKILSKKFLLRAN